MTGNIPLKFSYQGKEFSADQSKGCYIEVAYREQLGYLGVNLQGTKENPYCWHTEKSFVTDEGLRKDNVSRGGLRENLDQLCQQLVKLQERADAQKAFDREEACEDLHDFFKELGE